MNALHLARLALVIVGTAALGVLAPPTALAFEFTSATAPAPRLQTPPDTTAVSTPRAIERIEIAIPPLLPDPLVRRRRAEMAPRLEPFAYLARSVVCPGWGQHALGDTRKSLTYGLLFGVSLPLAAGLVPFPLVEDLTFSRAAGFAIWAAVAAAAGVDAFRGAERINRENGYDLEFRYGLHADRHGGALHASEQALHALEQAGARGVNARLVVLRREF